MSYNDNTRLFPDKQSYDRALQTELNLLDLVGYLTPTGEVWITKHRWVLPVEPFTAISGT